MLETPIGRPIEDWTACFGMAEGGLRDCSARQGNSNAAQCETVNGGKKTRERDLAKARPRCRRKEGLVATASATTATEAAATSSATTAGRAIFARAGNVDGQVAAIE